MALPIPLLDTLCGALHTACILLLSISSLQQDSKLLEGGNGTSYFSEYPSVQLPLSTLVPKAVHHIQSSIMKPQSSKISVNFILFVLPSTRNYSHAVKTGPRDSDEVSISWMGSFNISRLDDHLMPRVPSNFGKETVFSKSSKRKSSERITIALRLSHEPISETIIVTWQIWCPG